MLSDIGNLWLDLILTRVVMLALVICTAGMLGWIRSTPRHDGPDPKPSHTFHFTYVGPIESVR